MPGCIITYCFDGSFNMVVTTIAHNFTPSESASFISLIDQIRSAVTPLNQYDLSNKTEIVKQVQDARMLLTDNVLKELD